MRFRIFSCILLVILLTSVLCGCEVDPTQAATDVTQPSEEVPIESTAPSEPSVPGVPEDAVLGEDGNYVQIQYVNAMDSVVDQSKAEYITTTVFTPDGKVLSSEQVSAKTGKMTMSRSYAYENDVISSITSLYFDKNGKFRLHYCEYFAADGALSKKVDMDENGRITQSVEYLYFETGSVQFESTYDENGNLRDQKEYNLQEQLICSQRWHASGKLNEMTIYSDGKIQTLAVYDENEELISWLEYWANGELRLSKSLGHFVNDTFIKGWVISEYSQEGFPQHEVLYYPNGAVYTETYYYPSGNIKTSYWCDIYSTYHTEYYAEFLDGAFEPSTGWNVIEGEKVYFGKGMQDQHPDWVYDDRGNLLQYTVTENGYTYEVHRAYDAEDRCVSEEKIGTDGSRYIEKYQYSEQGKVTVHVERSGKFCALNDTVLEIYEIRNGMHYYEWRYRDGGYTISIDSASGKPYYLTYFYADGRKEVYEYDEGELTYMYIECEDGSVIEKGTPRG